MNAEFYEYNTSETGNTYSFVSKGRNGDIPKVVLIRQIPNFILGTESKKLYNLGFGDIAMQGNKALLDDSIRSNNGDMPKVIATVLRIAIGFMTDNPDALLLFQGYADGKTTADGRNQRNVLYQRVIESNWDELNPSYRIYGVKENQRVEYAHRGCFDAILITSR